jgi:predicted esterase
VTLPRFELLPVAGFGPAVVSIPPTSVGRPLLVVAHGAGGQPEWHCDLWSHLVGARGFVLCPRGRRIDRRVSYSTAGCYFPDHHFLTDVVNASRASLVAAYPGRVDADGAVFAGYSQGATMGALMVAKVPEEFPRALFIEGGGAQWNVPIGMEYRRGGGQRIAFLCGVAGCAAHASAGQRWLGQANVAARAVHVAGAGHTSGGVVAEKLPALFEWLVADDPRWKPDS